MQGVVLAPKAAFFGVFELFEEFFLFFAEVFRSFYNDGDDVWTTIAVRTKRHTVAREFEWGARLSAGGDFHSDFAVYGFDFDFGAKCGVHHIDVLFG